MPGNKQPVSILAVIYNSNPLTESDIEVLLLERADLPGYWQSVTGSRDGEETMRETAIREVLEETGLVAGQYELSDWQCQNHYEIYPHWQHRYPVGVTQNVEHVFGVQLPVRVEIKISPREHLNYQWLPLQAAADKVFSPSNRDMILQLPQRVIRKLHE